MTYIFAIIGALSGFFLSRKRGGAGFDILHYVVIFGIVGALIGFILSVVLLRISG